MYVAKTTLPQVVEMSIGETLSFFQNLAFRWSARANR